MLGPIPTTRSERWEWIYRFVRTWSDGNKRSAGKSDRRLDDAERRLGINLPLGLRAWYSLLGGYFTFWSAQDRFLPPELLEFAGTKLVFFVDCQSVVKWDIRVSGAKSLDPPVWVDLDELSEGSFQERDSLSAFAVAMARFMRRSSRRNFALQQTPAQRVLLNDLFRQALIECRQRIGIGQSIQPSCYYLTRTSSRFKGRQATTVGSKQARRLAKELTLCRQFLRSVESSCERLRTLRQVAQLAVV
jgi:hypothetical protein